MSIAYSCLYGIEYASGYAHAEFAYQCYVTIQYLF